LETFPTIDPYLKTDRTKMPDTRACRGSVTVHTYRPDSKTPHSIDQPPNFEKEKYRDDATKIAEEIIDVLDADKALPFSLFFTMICWSKTNVLCSFTRYGRSLQIDRFLQTPTDLSKERQRFMR